MSAFNIKEDLETRQLDQKITIMWISGPRAFHAQKISEILGCTVEQIEEVVDRMKLPRKTPQF